MIIWYTFWLLGTPSNAARVISWVLWVQHNARVFLGMKLVWLVRRSPKCIRIKSAGRVKENLKNIICYRCYESSKADKCHTFLVSFIIIPLPWPEWITSYFLLRCKIFWKTTHQIVRREAQPNTAQFFQGRS